MATIFVDQFSNGDYTTIQAAVAAAGSGDRIVIAGGTYAGAIDVQGKDLTLQSLNAGRPPEQWSAANTVTVDRIGAANGDLTLDGIKVVGTSSRGDGTNSAIEFVGGASDALTVRNSVVSEHVTGVAADDQQASGFNISSGTGSITIDHVNVVDFQGFTNPAVSNYGVYINGSTDPARAITITNSNLDTGTPRSIGLVLDGQAGGSQVQVHDNHFGAVGTAPGAIRAYDFADSLTGTVDYRGITNNTFSDSPGTNGLMTNETNIDGSGHGVVVQYGAATYAGGVHYDSVLSAADAATGQILTGTGGADLIVGSAFNDDIAGGAGNDIIRGGGGVDTLTGGAGDDTVVLGFKLTDASISYDAAGHTVLDGPNGAHNVLSGFEHFQFTDGTVNENTGSALVDDLYYYVNNKDVFVAGVDAETHYNQSGWHEGRNPNADFSTTGYLAANSDVAKAGINPLTHYDQFGWKEGRDPAANFDNELYLANNPDVKAAGIDPLNHYLQFGQAEGRQAYAAIGKAGDLGVHPGFDAEYYLLSNTDVAKAALTAGGDSFAFAYNHYEAFGWHEGRNPNAVFDTKGYLNAYADVKAANIDPLAHYDGFGWHEGRDPSASFDTNAYEAANADVKAAGIDPMLHYLQYGAIEGRSAFADGVFHPNGGVA